MDNQQEQFASAEITNGRWAMIGIMAALGAYAYTGQIIPGVFNGQQFRHMAAFTGTCCNDWLLGNHHSVYLL